MLPDASGWPSGIVIQGPAESGEEPVEGRRCGFHVACPEFDVVHSVPHVIATDVRSRRASLQFLALKEVGPRVSDGLCKRGWDDLGVIHGVDCGCMF